MNSAIRFIRKDGRIIPIAAAAAGSSAVKGGAAAITHHVLKKQGVTAVKGNPYLKAASEFLVTAGGFASGAALKFGGKGLLAGAVADEVVGLTASGLGAAAFAGKGQRKERAAGIAKQELKLQALGWGAFGAGAMSSKGSRAVAAKGVGKALSFARKVVGV
jgi:hypothetical protein